MNAERRAQRLLAAVLALFSKQGRVCAFAADLLNRERVNLKLCPPKPHILPVCSNVQLNLIEQGPVASVDAVLKLFHVLWAEFHWLQNQGYRETLGSEFYDNYGYCSLVGPNGFFSSSEFRLGFLLLGPQCHYPEHFHPAQELYVPLYGEALWSRGSGAYKRKQVGEPVFHESNELHAMRTTDHPLLALYFWSGDIEAPATLRTNS